METRLQQLRRARSDAVRARFSFELETMRKLVGCAGCGCDPDGYSLECPQCWDRARGRVRRCGDPVAVAYLTERRQIARDEGGRKHAETMRDRAAHPNSTKNGGHRWWEGRPAWLI